MECHPDPNSLVSSLHTDTISDVYKYRCIVCGDTNPRNVQSEYHADYFCDLYHCLVCGCESRFDPVPQFQVSQTYGQPVVYGSARSYERKSHITERLSAHICMEPHIPEHDKKIIRKKHNEKLRQYPDSYCTGKLTKAKIRTILREIDYDAIPTQIPADPEPKENKKKNGRPKIQKKRGFSTKYLEKFKSIIFFLTDGKQTFQTMTGEDIANVGQLFNFLSQTWNKWKSENRYPERKHFPNFNLVFRRIFKELQIVNVDLEEFPLPGEESVLCLQQYVDALIAEARLKNRL